jgi:hypothetical protein
MENFAMVRKLIALFAALITLVSLDVLAQTAVAANTTEHANSFVKQAEQIYQQSLDAEKRGDVDLYKRTRSKATYDGTIENLKRMGKSASDLSAMLKNMVALQTDLSKFTFLRCDAKTNVARLLYRRDGKDEDGPTVEFAVFMIHLEGDEWRIGWVGNSPGPKIFMGKERTVDEILENPRFALK